ncbi:sigma factor-binding protein Crl [Oceanimonas sp. NS1]|uniref:Sigma factor-binding protein Crl n=1 Tax=Oceanimonas doudoroffii TaxID=84158 RepID=A0A233RBL9_9GAMM|nr:MULTISPECIES: sigma factor-binding protein Crl [Oceanimonas]MCT7655952.1 sigma factor-binding protein Crl [Oceanimonas sp. NS1]NHI02187.1 Sigma factor-binding protein Crl [Oceanimonas sp. MB9]OXY80783.1 sigma factor-binding protein Crl [Oceanimonas doudoroffii]
MSTEAVSHQKLLRLFAAIGPYLRSEQSEEQAYFFDCLAVCASAKVEPEKREFWGWWLVLAPQDEQRFEFHYRLGYYDAEGNWQERDIPRKHEEEVARTLRDFYDKLAACLDELSLSATSSPELGDKHLLSPA